jgi:hypothetical protein
MPAALPDRDPREIVAFFDAKPYERDAFDARRSPELGVHYFEPRLAPSTVALAQGYPAVCVFVNDELSAEEVRYICDHSGARMLLADTEYLNALAPVLESLCTVVEVVAIDDPLGPAPPDAAAHATDHHTGEDRTLGAALGVRGHDLRVGGCVLVG